MVLNHLTTLRSLHLSNDPASDVWELVLDIDNKQGGHFAPLESRDLAHQINRERFRGRAYAEPSRRGKGAYLRFRVQPPAGGAADAIARIKAIESQLQAAYGRRSSGPNLEAVKGIPVLTLPNEEYDEEFADSPVSPVSDFHYHNPTLMELGWIQSERQHYDYYKEHYPKRFEPVPWLERTRTKIDQHSSAPAPCCYRPGEPVDAVLAKLARYASWSAATVPFTLDELEELCSALPAVTQPPPARRKSAAAIERDRQFAELLRQCDEEEAECNSAAPAVASPGIWEMINSGDKVRETGGVVFLGLQMTRGRFDSELTHSLYERHVADGRPRDAQRDARINSAGRWAEQKFEVKRAGVQALEALDRQSGTPAWFTTRDIEDVVDELQELVAPEDLGTTSYRAVAVAYLTLRKNIYLGEKGLTPDRIKKARKIRNRIRELLGMKELGGDGIEVPTRAVTRMLEHYRLRRSGRAVADILRILTGLNAIVCSNRSYQSGVFDEAGRKVEDGYCRRYKLGPVALLAQGRAGAKIAAHPTRVSFSEEVCSPAPSRIELGRTFKGSVSSFSDVEAAGIPCTGPLIPRLSGSFSSGERISAA